MTRQQILGWAAVVAQFAAIGLILFATGTVATSPNWLWLIGLGCIVAGVVVMGVAFLNLGPALTPTPVPNRTALRQHGLYRWIRHPIYTGLLLIMAGVALRSFGWLPLVGWLVLLAILSIKARWEEHMLSDVYPGYREYVRTTGRFLPRP